MKQNNMLDCCMSVIFSYVIGGSRGRAGRTPPYRTQFFRFHIHFCQKVPVSEVHAPPMGPRSPTGNPGSATVCGCGCCLWGCK